MKIYAFIGLLVFFNLVSCTNTPSETSSDELKETEVQEPVYDEEIKKLRGFQDFILGDSLPSNQLLLKSDLQNMSPEVVYRKILSNYTIGDILVEDFFVTCYKGRLKHIVFWVDIKYSKILVNSYIEKYGSGRIEDFNTLLPATLENATVRLNIEQKNDKARVVYSYKPLEQELAHDIKEARLKGL